MPRCLPQEVTETSDGWVEIKVRRSDIQTEVALDTSLFIVQQLQGITSRDALIAIGNKDNDAETSRYLDEEVNSTNNKANTQTPNKPLHTFRIVYNGNIVAKASTLSDIQADLNYIVAKYVMFWAQSTADSEESDSSTYEEEVEVEDFSDEESLDEFGDEFFDEGIEAEPQVLAQEWRPPVGDNEMAATPPGHIRVAPNFIFFLEREYQTLHVGKQHSFFSFKPFDEQKQYIQEHGEYLRLMDSEVNFHSFDVPSFFVLFLLGW
jgi:hypothetical protein